MSGPIDHEQMRLFSEQARQALEVAGPKAIRAFNSFRVGFEGVAQNDRKPLTPDA